MTAAAVTASMSKRRLSGTLGIYIAKSYAIWLLAIYALFIAIIFAASIVDMLDRASGKEYMTIGLAVQMAMLRVPQLSFEIMPFAVLGASAGAFWRLARTHELVIARAAGISVWQTLLPPTLVAFVVGLVTIMMINPLASVLTTKYAQLELKYLRGQTSFVSLSKTGLWLRQSDGEDFLVIHADSVEAGSLKLNGVMVIRFDAENRWKDRLDAASAVLEDGRWRFLDSWLTRPGYPAEAIKEAAIATDLKPDSISENFAPPETISFWELPGFIDDLNKAGFSSLKHRLMYWRLIVLPFYYAAMVLLAASFSLRPHRRGSVTLVLGMGLVAGFGLYFLSSFIFAFGLSGRIPLMLAAWAPAAIPAMVGVTLLLHLEDG